MEASSMDVFQLYQEHINNTIEFMNINLMSDPEGNSQFCFHQSPDVSRDEVGFPRDLSTFKCFVMISVLARVARSMVSANQR